MVDDTDETATTAQSPPVRDARRNEHLVDTGASAEGDVLLPSLDEGITLLTVEGSRGVPALQSLVVDHLLVADGPAVWVDAGGHATTTTLARIAPSERILDRIRVARGFTAYQHYAAVCDIPDGLGANEQSPSLLVAPALDAQYRADDTLGTEQARRLQTRALARLAAYASEFDVPVLVTCSERDSFTDPVESAADRSLHCEQTPMGPRFVGDEFETLVYPVGDGAYYQTTLSYWRDLLDVRARQAGLATDSPSPDDSETAVGTAATAGGGTATATARPMLDAWHGGGR